MDLFIVKKPNLGITWVTAVVKLGQRGEECTRRIGREFILKNLQGCTNRNVVCAYGL